MRSENAVTGGSGSLRQMIANATAVMIRFFTMITLIFRIARMMVLQQGP